MKFKHLTGHSEPPTNDQNVMKFKHIKGRSGFPLKDKVARNGTNHSRLSRVLTSLIDIWDDIRGLLLSNS